MLAFDSVYFFASPTWRSEQISNRVHFGRRWAREVPVVIIQPERRAYEPGWSHEPDSRLNNVEILSILSTFSAPESSFATGLVQASQISAFMRNRGHKRPLLWLFHPLQAYSYAFVPGVARVFHCTENYFQWPELSTEYLDLVSFASRISDLVISVGSGLAEIIREKTGNQHVIVFPNGCDRNIFFPGPPTPKFTRLHEGYQDLAVFAGGINQRIDFDLLLSAASAHPNTRFCLFGPSNLSHIGRDESVVVDKFFQCPNVYLGPMLDEKGVRDLYRTGSVGIIPYKRIRWIEEGAFPSKVFEMLSTGLPIVSTFMRSIVGLSEGIFIAETHAEFIGALGRTSKAHLPACLAHRMQELSDRNSYDVLFPELRGTINNVAQDRRPSIADIGGASSGSESYKIQLGQIEKKLSYSNQPRDAILWAVQGRKLLATRCLILLCFSGLIKPARRRFKNYRREALLFRYRIARTLPSSVRKTLKRLIAGPRDWRPTKL